MDDNYYSNYFRTSMYGRLTRGWDFSKRELERAKEDPPAGFRGLCVRHCPACGEFQLAGQTRCTRCQAFNLFRGEVLRPTTSGQPGGVKRAALAMEASEAAASQ